MRTLEPMSDEQPAGVPEPRPVAPQSALCDRHRQRSLAKGQEDEKFFREKAGILGYKARDREPHVAPHAPHVASCRVGWGHEAMFVSPAHVSAHGAEDDGSILLERVCINFHGSSWTNRMVRRRRVLGDSPPGSEFVSYPAPPPVALLGERRAAPPGTRLKEEVCLLKG